MLLFFMSVIIWAVLSITQGVVLFPLDVIGSLHLPHWISLVVILVVLSWCLGN
ncbi:hypothetical protein PL9214650077 [Planktothrix tepida PCC 9214]|uniref:Uncharacterized protein n=1 Tax=Planktothrix tepida PCC 9214 TaxID=671072 RepID=A0A1J1LQY7_9CYAN|nr:hypothetical protein PL9214650077 [Planktothrix tepida PCC 9214]